MTAAFHVWLYGRFTELESNLRRKKIHRTNQGSNFLGGSFSSRYNVTAPIQFGRESQPSILKNNFSSRKGPSIFTSIAALLLDHLSKTSLFFPALKLTSHCLPHSTVSCRLNLSSEANSSCCHRSDAWSHIE